MQAKPAKESSIDMSNSELSTFLLRGKLPQAVLTYREQNDNRLPANLYVPLGQIVDSGMAAREREAAMGKKVQPLPADDLRVTLYTQDPIMRELLEPFRQQRQQLQQTPLTESEQKGLQQGQVPKSITGYLNDYQGEVPANAIKPVSDAVVETTLSRKGEMYPQFEMLYRRSIELPGLVDEPIRQGLKDQGLLPQDSQNWRVDIAKERSSSQAIQLGIAEGVQTSEMSLMLPNHARQLRQYLEGDNYLSNEEVSKAIFNENTTRDQMNKLVEKLDSTKQPDVQKRVTDYLMELKETTQQFPAVVHHGSKEPIDVVSLMNVIRTHQTGETVTMLPPPGEVIKNIDLLERLKNAFSSANPLNEQNQTTGKNAGDVQVPNPNKGQSITGQNGNETDGSLRISSEKPSGATAPKRSSDENESSGGLLTKILQIKLTEGGMVSNFLNNYKIIQDFMDKLFKGETYGLKPKDTQGEQKQQDGPSRANQLPLDELIRELERRTRPVGATQATNLQESPAQRAEAKQTAPVNAAAQPDGKVSQTTRVNPVIQPDVKVSSKPDVGGGGPIRPGGSTPSDEPRPKSIVSRLMDHFLDKLAIKLIDRLETRQQTTPSENLQPKAVTNQPVKEVPRDGVKSTISNEPVLPLSPAQAKPADKLANVTGIPNIPETFRQQAAFVTQEKRFNWEQIRPQMDKLGISEKSIDPMNKALLLDGYATNPNVSFNIKDRNGITAPVQGKLVLIEIPGKGPQVHIEPPKLKTALVIPPGLSVYTEDVMRLQKTGMANRPIPYTDPQTQIKRNVLVGYDPVNKVLRTIDKESIKVPAEVKGLPLSPQQQELLQNGKQITLKGLQGLDNKPYSATMQFSAVDGQFRLDRIGKKQTETIKQASEMAPSQRQTANQGFVVYLKGLSPENNQKWLNTPLEVKTGEGKQVLKKVKDLTYTDSVLVAHKDAQKKYTPLTMKPQENTLLSPAEQARLLIKLEKNPPVGGINLQKAQPFELEKAKARYQTQTQTATSVVSKNGADRITQNQTGSLKEKSPNSDKPQVGQSTRKKEPSQPVKPTHKPTTSRRIS